MSNELLPDILKLIGGIFLLVYSGDYLVKGGIGLAKHFKLSRLVIGLTVVAFGTSAPELVVSLGAAVSGFPDIALGNVIGSNIANIALVLAITVIILPMPVAAQTIKRSWPVMFISGIFLYFAMHNNIVTQIEGTVMFIFLMLFIVGSIRTSKSAKYKVVENIEDNKKDYKLWLSIVIIIISSSGLAFGSKLLVTGASSIASYIGVTERVIGITVVAFGTSLPELTTSVIAAIKKETDISVGNIVGSNIFNVFAVIGITSMVQPISFKFSDYHFDLNYMIGFYLLLFIFILPLKFIFTKNEGTTLKSRYNFLIPGKISRIEGGILFAIYIQYIIFLL